MEGNERGAVGIIYLDMSSSELMFLMTAPNKFSRKLKCGTASSNIQMQRTATRLYTACFSTASSFCIYAC